MNVQQVKRYHKSFIGLMEQCKDGEWVRGEDFDSLQIGYLEVCKNNNNLVALAEVAKEKLSKQETLVEEQQAKLAKAKSIIAWHRAFLAMWLPFATFLIVLAWRFF